MTQHEGDTFVELSTSELWEEVFSRANLFAYWEKCRATGVDRMRVKELPDHLKAHWVSIRAKLDEGKYQPSPKRRVEIPKAGGGMRQLGIPPVLKQSLNLSRREDDCLRKRKKVLYCM